MFIKRKKLLAYVFVFIVFFLILFAGPTTFNSLKLQVVESTSLPIRILLFPLNELKKILYYHRTYDEYVRLRRESDTLKERLIGLEEVIHENTRLEQLLNLKRTLLYSSVVAGIIGRDPSNWNASMILNKGLDDGVSVGMPVVNASGVVGKIAEVGTKTSKVILLNDPQFSVAALVQRPRETGLVSGTLSGLCRMRYLSIEADVKVGDKVITSQISSSFPEGLMIGEIVNVKSSKLNSTIECLIRPTVSLSQIEEVLIIQK